MAAKYKKRKVKEASFYTSNTVPMSWQIPDDTKQPLSEFIPEEYFSDIEEACNYYLFERQQEEQYPTELELLTAAEDVKNAVKTMQSAIEKCPQVVTAIRMAANSLKADDETMLPLTKNDGLAHVVDAIGKAVDKVALDYYSGSPKKGKPPGSRSQADRYLVGELAEIYKKAYGKYPRRAYDTYGDSETGPLHKILDILSEPLGLKDTLRGILKEFDKHISIK